MRRLAVAVLVFFALCSYVVACGHGEAIGVYGAEQAACVEAAKTLAESKACRAAGRARLGLDGGTE